MALLSESPSRLLKLLEDGKEVTWYNSKAWKDIRAAVLAMDHYECQLCKAKGRYRRAEIVHHMKHLKDRPDLALSIWDGKERQLISVCRACHEKLHPERDWRPAMKKERLTVERWD